MTVNVANGVKAPAFGRLGDSFWNFGEARENFSGFDGCNILLVLSL